MPDFKLQQSQRAQLSAQQILTSQLLQLPLLNLEQRIYDELQDNPVLELVEEKHESVSERDDSDDMDEHGDGMFDSVERFEPGRDKTAKAEERSSDQDQALPNFTIDRTPKEHFFQAVQEDSLEEHMLRELSLREDLDQDDLLIAAEVFGNLDDDGYLPDGAAFIVDSLESNHGLIADVSDVNRIIDIVSRMEPAGIGVASLRERLIVQLESRRGDLSPRLYADAVGVLHHHFDDLLNNRHEKILREMQISPARLEAVVNLVVTLDPHPYSEPSGTSQYIVPDFVVTYEEGKLTASLNDRSNLSVRVSEAYREMLGNRSIPRADRSFVRQNVHKAKEFTSAIAQRRHTLLSVIRALMEFQYDFFVSGPSVLHPLTMKEVAQKTGFDLSTISRAVNGKYVQTRFGTFELKYFFSGGMTTEDGEEMSTRLVKARLKQMIEQENPSKPLSDDRLAGMLEEKGIKVARRTVAKYREQMQIPVARLRKKIF
ncbi:MAG TPA: RNA polymerase sigma-54 factor [Prosthecochloris aestuarii]|uniref:RNA polymerase sigma-54 factor n=1 Tax=Prosthecochloris aestuarii TaxID=1102 RepID=A0A831ST72_PROAE|nr:RNA polymerase sigma-54 factor [Prosthecochloris aestuarii]